MLYEVITNPPTKRPLARLLAQARAFGLGIVLSTQHPVEGLFIQSRRSQQTLAGDIEIRCS